MAPVSALGLADIQPEETESANAIEDSLAVEGIAESLEPLPAEPEVADDVRGLQPHTFGFITPSETGQESIEEKAVLEEAAIEDGPSIDVIPLALPVVEHEKATHTDLLFEPFHTVDYFASQGIRALQEQKPDDKLGKGLKSFTEWLKTMKRLPVAETVNVPASAAERKVESMAGSSVQQSEVVTEAMAEVWAKQGNTVKALDIYNKLSLQNPSRTAYFAAKIQTLNNA